MTDQELKDLVAVDIPEAMIPKVLEQGFYLARINEEQFSMLNPPEFAPFDFSAVA